MAKMNKKLLNKLSDQAMPVKSKPCLYLSGAQAKPFHEMRPGAEVGARVRGTLRNIGFGYAGKEPTAEIELTEINSEKAGTNPKGKKGKEKY